ncbi:MAG: DUF1036 domain-containing protein [Pseudomonadota bacterium]
MPPLSRIALIVFCATAASISTADAKYSFCNKTSYVLSAAIAYVEGDRLATRGWWRLNSGQCKVVLTEETNPGRYFVYAEAFPGHRGPLRSWSGDTPLCVELEGFFNLRNQEVCKNDPSRQREFFTVDVSEDANGDWRTDFAEAKNYSVFSAEVAGVQRLLSDIGEFDGSIDGSLGRRTQRAIANYRQKKNLGDGSDIDDATINSLIDEATAKESKAGFYMCNKGDKSVWSAIAEPEDGDYRSRGWWLIDAGDCVKIIKGRLTSDHYFVYGLVEDGSVEKRLAGGDERFCVNDVKFNVMNDRSCADQELDEAIFRRVEIGAATSATYDFFAESFVAPPTSVNN